MYNIYICMLCCKICLKNLLSFPFYIHILSSVMHIRLYELLWPILIDLNLLHTASMLCVYTFQSTLHEPDKGLGYLSTFIQAVLQQLVQQCTCVMDAKAAIHANVQGCSRRVLLFHAHLVLALRQKQAETGYKRDNQSYGVFAIFRRMEN